MTFQFLPREKEADNSPHLDEEEVVSHVPPLGEAAVGHSHTRFLFERGEGRKETRDSVPLQEQAEVKHAFAAGGLPGPCLWKRRS